MSLDFCHDSLEGLASCDRCNAIAQGCETEEEVAALIAEWEREAARAAADDDDFREPFGYYDR